MGERDKDGCESLGSSSANAGSFEADIPWLCNLPYERYDFWKSAPQKQTPVNATFADSAELASSKFSLDSFGYGGYAEGEHPLKLQLARLKILRSFIFDRSYCETTLMSRCR